MTDEEQLTAEALDGPTYRRRCTEVYWHRAPACGARGHHNATCLRFAGHQGFHQGNGFDTWGPKGCYWRD